MRTQDGRYGRFQMETTTCFVVYPDGMDTGTRIWDKMPWDNVKARRTSPKDRLLLFNSTTVMEVSTQQAPKSLPSQQQHLLPPRHAILYTTDGLSRLMMRVDVQKGPASAAMVDPAVLLVSTVEL